MDNKTLGMILALGGGGNGGGGGSLIPVPTAQDAGKMLIVGVVQGEAGYQLVAFDEPMKFKGTLGTGGTITTLPAASSANNGYTYLVITDGTYAGQEAEAGDQFISNGEAWWRVPSGDEDSVIDDSVTSTALTWSSDKLSGLFDGVKVKNFTYTGNGSTTVDIVFSEVPTIILGIFGYQSANSESVMSMPIMWGSAHGIGAFGSASFSAATFSFVLSFNDKTMSLTGQNQRRALNTVDTYTVYYI